MTAFGCFDQLSVTSSSWEISMHAWNICNLETLNGNDGCVFLSISKICSNYESGIDVFCGIMIDGGVIGMSEIVTESCKWDLLLEWLLQCLL